MRPQGYAYQGLSEIAQFSWKQTRQRVSSMALGAKTEVASSVRWTYGFLFL